MSQFEINLFIHGVLGPSLYRTYQTDHLSGKAVRFNRDPQIQNKRDDYLSKNSLILKLCKMKCEKF